MWRERAIQGLIAGAVALAAAAGVSGQQPATPPDAHQHDGQTSEAAMPSCDCCRMMGGHAMAGQQSMDHGTMAGGSCHQSMQARAASDARLNELAAQVKGASGAEKLAAADALAAEVIAQTASRPAMGCRKPTASHNGGA